MREWKSALGLVALILVWPAMLYVAAIIWPIEPLPELMEPVIATMVLVEPEQPIWTLQDQREVFCLAQNMYHEARSQEFAGQLAVSMVVLNRVKSKRFPDSICAVVYQAQVNSRGSPVRNKCHFSWWCDGQSDSMHNREVYNELHELAETIYKRRDVALDITYGATHYHANYVSPWWAEHMTRTAIVNDHIFYDYRKTND